MPMEHHTDSGSSTDAGSLQRDDSPQLVKSGPPSGPSTSSHTAEEVRGCIPHSYHAEFAGFEEGYIRNYISLADTKAAWTFTLVAGVLAYLFSKDTTRTALLNPEWPASYGVLVAAVILLVGSGLFSFLVVAPRLSTPSGEGVVFFESVAKKPSAQAYLAEVVASDAGALTEARLKHCYDVSRVCSRKYAALKTAIWLGLPGTALALIYSLIE